MGNDGKRKMPECRFDDGFWPFWGLVLDVRGRGSLPCCAGRSGSGWSGPAVPTCDHPLRAQRALRLDHVADLLARPLAGDEAHFPGGQVFLGLPGRVDSQAYREAK